MITVPLTQNNSAGLTRKNEGRAIFVLWLIWIIWLPFFTPALFDLYQMPPAAPQMMVILAGVILFFGIYLRSTWRNARRLFGAELKKSPVTETWLPLALMVALAFGLPLIVQRDLGDWLDLFIFTSAYVGGRYAPWRAIALIGLLAGLVLAAGQVLAFEWTGQGKVLIFVIVVGFVVIGLARLIRISRELQAAREEIARLAVINERLRIARDLHDLLGHNLALIALKSELARRLLEVAPQRATAELTEVEKVARTTLQEVREAVSAYRQPTLATELQGAQEILTAAGISYSYEGEAELLNALPPVLDTVLGWVVREGVTNVIKHSKAKSCIIRGRHNSGRVWLEIINDGAVLPATSASAGNGLRGLTERVTACGGQLTTKAADARGGFELGVCLPIGKGE